MGTVDNEVKVLILIEADPKDPIVTVVIHALQLQPLSLFGVLHTPVEEPDCHRVPVSLGTGAACGQKLATCHQVLLGKSCRDLWAGLFPTGVMRCRQAAGL